MKKAKRGILYGRKRMSFKEINEIIVFFPAISIENGIRIEHPPKIVKKKYFDGFGGVYKIYILKEST